MELLLLVGAISGFVWVLCRTFIITAVFSRHFVYIQCALPSLARLYARDNRPKDYARITSYLEIQGQVTTGIAAALGAWLLAQLDADSAWAIYRPLGQGWTMQEVFLLDAITYVSVLCPIAALALYRHCPTPCRKGQF